MFLYCAQSLPRCHAVIDHEQSLEPRLPIVPQTRQPSNHAQMRFQFFTRLTQASLFAAAGIVALDTAGPSSTKVNAAASITLDTQRTQLVGSVLDLFSGKPSLQRLAHWREDAHFEDPITTAKGRKAYAAQWCVLRFISV